MHEPFMSFMIQKRLAISLLAALSAGSNLRSTAPWACSRLIKQSMAHERACARMEGAGMHGGCVFGGGGEDLSAWT